MQIAPTRSTKTAVAEKTASDIQVGIADYKIAPQPNRIITLGLGSCVGVTFYDPVSKVGGLLHIMLPDSRQFTGMHKPEKFADLGIPLLLKEIGRLGGRKSNIQAKIAGGAQMFSGLNQKITLNVGERNVEMARKILKEIGIRLMAADVGGNKGRTMILDTKSGEVTIRTVGTPQKTL